MNDNNINNFTQLNKLIKNNEKEIVLNENIIFEKYEEYESIRKIRIAGNDIVIDGNGHTIDAQNKTRIFEITGKNIKIKNIGVIHGHAGDGGAIYNEVN